MGDDVYEGWVAPLNAALYPSAGRRDPRQAPNCPTFRKDSVLTRPDEDTAGPRTVSPGLHSIDVAPEAPFDVVWWDPAALRLDAEPPFGLRRQELISRDVTPEVIAEGQRRHRDWRQARDHSVATGGQPALAVRTATDWASVPARDEAPTNVTVTTIAGLDGRPTGPRYGTLVHAVLATVPLDADDEGLARVVGTQARIVAATGDEAASAASVVRAVLAHPLLQDARSAARTCRREAPVTVTIDGVLVEGVVDLAFEAADGATVVVDFKTDRPEGPTLGQYQRQVGLYAEAVARATGKPARAVLLQV